MHLTIVTSYDTALIMNLPTQNWSSDSSLLEAGKIYEQKKTHLSESVDTWHNPLSLQGGQTDRMISYTTDKAITWSQSTNETQRVKLNEPWHKSGTEPGSLHKN